MTSHSESVFCIRGCRRPGEHFAACEHQADDDLECTGCAPLPAADGLMVCEACRRRIRGLLRITPDLLGRMRTMASHGKAVVYSPVKVFRPASSVPDQVDAELADALIEISANLRDWARWIDMRTLKGVDRLLADRRQARALAAAVLDTHQVDEDGGRHWSVADAASKWGIERRDKSTFVYDDGGDGSDLIERTPVTEWFDRLLTIRQAADRVKRSQRSIEKWIEKGDLDVAMRVRIGDGTVLKSVYASHVDAVAARKKPGRPPRADTQAAIEP